MEFIRVQNQRLIIIRSSALDHRSRVTKGNLTHRGVLAKLAEGGEGFLVGLSDLFYDALQLGCQLVALCQLRLRALLLLLIAVISNS